MHTCMHAYIHAYERMYVRTYIHMSLTCILKNGEVASALLSTACMPAHGKKHPAAEVRGKPFGSTFALHRQSSSCAGSHQLLNSHTKHAHGKPGGSARGCSCGAPGPCCQRRSPAAGCRPLKKQGGHRVCCYHHQPVANYLLARSIYDAFCGLRSNKGVSTGTL